MPAKDPKMVFSYVAPDTDFAILRRVAIEDDQSFKVGRLIKKRKGNCTIGLSGVGGGSIKTEVLLRATTSMFLNPDDAITGKWCVVQVRAYDFMFPLVRRAVIIKDRLLNPADPSNTMNAVSASVLQLFDDYEKGLVQALVYNGGWEGVYQSKAPLSQRQSTPRPKGSSGAMGSEGIVAGPSTPTRSDKQNRIVAIGEAVVGHLHEVLQTVKASKQQVEDVSGRVTSMPGAFAEDILRNKNSCKEMNRVMGERVAALEGHKIVDFMASSATVKETLELSKRITDLEEYKIADHMNSSMTKQDELHKRLGVLEDVTVDAIVNAVIEHPRFKAIITQVIEEAKVPETENVVSDEGPEMKRARAE